VKGSKQMVSAIFLCGLVAMACGRVFGEAQGQAPPTPAALPEARQFDFWIGEWDLISKQRASPTQDKWMDGKATNSIRAILDGHVVQENFDGSALGQPFKGMSVSVYNPQLKKWQQTWVDSQGAYLDLVGEFKDGKMVLGQEMVRNGKPVKLRMIFFNITKDRFDWNWESSRDEGKTWTILWKITYVRRKA
jgi:hypothetical protein